MSAWDRMNQWCCVECRVQGGHRVLCSHFERFMRGCSGCRWCGMEITVDDRGACFACQPKQDEYDSLLRRGKEPLSEFDARWIYGLGTRDKLSCSKSYIK